MGPRALKGIGSKSRHATRAGNTGGHRFLIWLSVSPCGIPSAWENWPSFPTVEPHPHPLQAFLTPGGKGPQCKCWWRTHCLRASCMAGTLMDLCKRLRQPYSSLPTSIRIPEVLHVQSKKTDGLFGHLRQYGVTVSHDSHVKCYARTEVMGVPLGGARMLKGWPLR